MGENHYLKNSMQYGAYCGIALFAVTLVSYMMGSIESGSKIPGYLCYLLLAVFQFIGTKNLRDQHLNGYMSYGQSLGSGLLIAFFSSIIIGFFTYIMFNFIDTNLVNVIIEKAEQQLIEDGMPESQIETSMHYMKMFMTPGMMFLFTIISYVLIGFIFSLISSIFTKKEASPFSENH